MIWNYVKILGVGNKPAMIQNYDNLKFGRTRNSTLDDSSKTIQGYQELQLPHKLWTMGYLDTIAFSIGYKL